MENQESSNQTLSGFVHVFDRIDQPIIITTARNKENKPKIVYVNDAFENISGYKLYELIGKSPKIFQGKLSAKSEMKPTRGAERQSWLTVNYRKNGSHYPA